MGSDPTAAIGGLFSGTARFIIPFRKTVLRNYEMGLKWTVQLLMSALAKYPIGKLKLVYYLKNCMFVTVGRWSITYYVLFLNFLPLFSVHVHWKTVGNYETDNLGFDTDTLSVLIFGLRNCYILYNFLVLK